MTEASPEDRDRMIRSVIRLKEDFGVEIAKWCIHNRGFEKLYLARAVEAVAQLEADANMLWEAGQ